MLRLAWQNLTQNRARLLISLGGVTLALTLVLVLDAVLTGAERQITAYIDHSGADVILSQPGVRTIHMSSSTLPATILDEVAAVPGVGSATPIGYVSNMLAINNERSPVYVIGLPPGAQAGTPWDLSAGASLPGPGETVVDADVAAAAGGGIGDTAMLLGRPFTIVGLSRGTANIVNSVAFITLDDFAQLRGGREVLSFVLIRSSPDVPSSELAARIRAQVEGVTVQTRQQFAAQDLGIVREMATDLVAIMNLVGFVIGLAVLVVIVYTTTLARRAEYGVLKALGARNSHLYRIVLAQSFMTVALAFASALIVTWMLGRLVPLAQPSLTLMISADSLVTTALVSMLLGGIAALLPIRQIAGLDPARVFRGGFR